MASCTAIDTLADMQEARTVVPDIHILPSFLPAPGIGNIPVNAFVLKSKQPVLIDTGMHHDHTQFMAELESVIDPSDLRWIWLTHPDQDHLGSLQALVNANPSLRVITTFLGFAILGLRDSLPPDRVYLLNPGEQIDVGDRTLVCLRPPTFDNPATTAMYDTRSRALFSSDCFGAALPTLADEAYAIPREDLRDGQLLWASVDAPWLHRVDRGLFGDALNEIRALDPSLVLSAHLPPARAMLPRLLDTLAEAPNTRPFQGPDQAAFAAMVAQMTQQAA
jgi:hypothetical protein